MSLDSFEAKLYTRSSGICTVTDTDVWWNEGQESGWYDTQVYFTLRTPDGKSYQTHDYWPSSFNEQADAQHYASEFHIKQAYQCWYNATNPGQAFIHKQDVTFWDYLGLALCVPLFLVVGVLPHLWLLRALCRFIINSVPTLYRFIANVVHGNTKIVW